MDVGGVGGIVTCYMLHVTLSVRAIHEGGVKNMPKEGVSKLPI